jgi:hypothetical protein
MSGKSSIKGKKNSKAEDYLIYSFKEKLSNKNENKIKNPHLNSK